MLPDRRPATLVLLRVVLWRLRRAGAALAAAALVLAVARTLAPPTPPVGEVVVAVREVAAGTTLRTQDVRVVRLPLAHVPAGATSDPAAVVGRGTAAALTPGLPVVEALLAGDRHGRRVPAGSVVVPVTLADDATAALLRPGDRVDLVRARDDADGGATEVLASRALVLDVAVPAPADAGPLGLGGSVAHGDHVVVAVAPGEGRRLAAVAGWGAVGAVLVG